MFYKTKTKTKTKKNLVLTFVIIFLFLCIKHLLNDFLELDIFVIFAIFTNTDGIFYYYFWRKWSEQALMALRSV
jgi:hypothetical protein